MKRWWVLALLLGSQQLMAVDKPNILLLMAEDMSARVGAFGDPVAVTPNIDQLAREGVRYPNTFTTAGVCAPSRAAHIMGAHQNSFGAQHMRTTSSHYPLQYNTVPPPQMKAYPELLRHAGYFTFVTDKLDYQFSGGGLGSGPFTIWDLETRSALPWKSDPFPWQQVPGGVPFFGFMTFMETHESGLFPRWSWPRSTAHTFLQALHIYLNRGVEDVVAPGDVAVPPYLPDTPPVRRDIARQYNNIHTMDLRVGMILAQLRADGLDDNTIVIWTTDHGSGVPRGKRELFDSGIKVPMVIRWPEKYRPADATPGTVDERLISFVDLGPTVLALAGVAEPDYMEGKPFAGVANPVPNTYIYAARDRLDEQPDRQRAVRDSRFKYIFNFYPGEPGAAHLEFRDTLDSMRDLWAQLDAGKLDAAQRRWFAPRLEEELYDTWTDPDELRNLADSQDYAAQLERMRAAFADWQQRGVDMGAIPEEQMVREFWPNLEQPQTATPSLARDEQGRVVISCTTQGASIGFRLGEDGRWMLYTAPIAVLRGQVVTAKAVRYGWSESEEASL